LGNSGGFTARRKTMAKMHICILFVLLMSPALFAQKHPKEFDFPNQYIVLNTSTSSGVAAICTMAIQDVAVQTMGIILQQVHQYFGSCHTWDAGSVFHGRRNKGEVLLLVTDGHGNSKVEKWRIAGTVSLPAPKT
jgi:hypothetical protein